MPFIFYWHYAMTYMDEYEPMPDGIDWCLVRILPRYSRVCSERLRILLDADRRFQSVHNGVSPYLIDIARLQQFSQWEQELHDKIIDTEREPDEVAAVRAIVRIV